MAPNMSTDSSPGTGGFSVSYRRDIDGLRAIAVGSVFVFHLDPHWLPGGFIGVDIFFVISGFLITSILMNDLERDGIRLGTFYQRRVARLFPAMIVVVVATLIAARFIYIAQEYASAGVNSAAALLSVANIKFYFQGNYFDISPDSQPFLHFWSLSVEEQYYLIYPLMLMMLGRFGASVIARVLLVITALSLAACIAMTFVNAKAAFFLLPFRAWELGLGGLAAFVANGRMGHLPPALRPGLALAGLAAVAASLVVLHEGLAFPGYVALLPVAGTAALLLAGTRGAYPGQRLLASGPMVAIGKISYSLYLWHWPVFSLVDYALFAESDLLRHGLKVVVTLALTLATYALLETPARRTLNRPDLRLPVFAGFAVVLALSVPAGLWIRKEFYVNSSVTEAAEGGKLYPGPQGAPTVVLAGDSIGSNFGRTLRDMCHDLGCTLHVLSVAGKNSLPVTEGKDPALWRNSLGFIERTRPDVVILANHWSGKLSGGQEGRADLALQKLLPHAGHVVILGQLPALPPDATRAAMRDGARPPFAEPEADRLRRSEVNAHLSGLAGERVTYVDVASPFVRETGEVLFLDAQGNQMFRDERHLSDLATTRLRNRIEAAYRQGLTDAARAKTARVAD
ncbi:hypothetical protein CDZ98_04170 [Mameliella alba]|nr:hypothetical protein CDZ98_04170 [Mameliella alba]